MAAGCAIHAVLGVRRIVGACRIGSRSWGARMAPRAVAAMAEDRAGSAPDSAAFHARDLIEATQRHRLWQDAVRRTLDR